jgi:hypothetical protein
MAVLKTKRARARLISKLTGLQVDYLFAFLMLISFRKFSDSYKL